MPVRSLSRRALALIIAATSTVAIVFGTASAAHADSGSDAAAQLVTLTNADRSNAGLSTLTVASDLTAVALQHSQEMASKGTLYHNQQLGTQVTNWLVVEENVGNGTSPDQINSGFMASPVHSRNIL